MATKERSTWGSSATFILAAIGSAVGLGNAWRFPNLAAKHGGGAFLLVYLAAMLIIGIPLLMMEISIKKEILNNHTTMGKIKRPILIANHWVMWKLTDLILMQGQIVVICLLL